MNFFMTGFVGTKTRFDTEANGLYRFFPAQFSLSITGKETNYFTSSLIGGHQITLTYKGLGAIISFILLSFAPAYSYCTIFNDSCI